MPTYKYKNNQHGSLYVPGEKLPLTSSTLPMPLVKPPKKEKIQRIYEDDNFIVDLIHNEDPVIRVSIFEDGHFKDEVLVRKSEYIN